MGKVKPKEIYCEIWMKKMQSEKRLTKNMKMKIGSDSNCAVEICSKKDCNIQACLGHGLNTHVLSRIHHQSENTFGHRV